MFLFADDDDLSFFLCMPKERANAIAMDLMATPLLQALPAVLQSGFLYQFECIQAASTCQNWYHVWKEAEDQLPFESMVAISVGDISRATGAATFVHRDGLLADLHTPVFAKTIFDKVNDLKEMAKKGNAAKRKFRSNLPQWGLDVRYVLVQYWGPIPGRNSGGVCITYLKYGFSGCSLMMVRLDPRLCLWTGIRNWKDYDWRPLWRPSQRPETPPTVAGPPETPQNFRRVPWLHSDDDDESGLLLSSPETPLWSP